MEYYEVAPNRIVRAGSDSFTYSSSRRLSIGQIVTVELGSKEQVGVVVKRVAQPSYKTKSIIATIGDASLPQPLLQLALWMRDYYATPLATVFQTVLPRGITKKRRPRINIDAVRLRDRTQYVLTDDQRNALEVITAMNPGSALVHGVTGSGKTRLYIELAERAVANGKSVIVLVPEIALTSQLVDEFSHHFENIILTHSRQTEAERHHAWLEALHSTIPRIVVGPRSALFMPLIHIGLIVIDESHEPSFKQEQAPRYSTLRAASILARYHRAKVVMGSATPLISEYYLAKQSDRPIIQMNTRAKLGAIMPTITVVDLTKKQSFKKHRFLSNTLLDELERTFATGNQALIFHNRRGSASTTLCDNCGWTSTCPRCFVPFTLHADRHHLQCHICGSTERVPTSCPECHNADIIHKGIGTKLIESELRKFFPDKKIVRFDADATKENSVDKRYKELYDGSIELMIGTQVVAKGLDLPHLRMVGVIQADAGLSLPDYGASERTFQLLAQVVGRVGRTEHPTSVIIQSYQPNPPAVVDGIAQDYEHFYETTLAERKRAKFPPHTFLLQLTCVYKTEAAAVRNAQAVARNLRAVAPKDIDILGPTPAFYERQHETYRWQLLIKSPKRSDLAGLLKHIPSTHWHAELDPLSLL